MEFFVKLFLGLWLFPLGYHIFKSGFLPRILGIMLMTGCFGYLIESFILSLSPNLKVNFYPGLAIVFIAEVSFILWLTIKGVNVEPWEQYAIGSA